MFITCFENIWGTFSSKQNKNTPVLTDLSKKHSLKKKKRKKPTQDDGYLKAW